MYIQYILRFSQSQTKKSVPNLYHLIQSAFPWEAQTAREMIVGKQWVYYMEENNVQNRDMTSPAPAEEEATKARRAPTKRKKASDPAAEAEAKAASMPFEAAAARLEEIVKALEGGTLSLEESLSLYEEGVALVRRCTGELDQAKQRVMALRRRADGTVEAAAFTTPEDS